MKSGPLLLDTGGWLLALAGVPAHAAALRTCSRAIVPGLVLAEVDWHLRFKRRQMHTLLRELSAGAYVSSRRRLAISRELSRSMRSFTISASAW